MKSSTVNARGIADIRCAPFPVAVAMGDDDVYIYEWGTINGLIRINAVCGVQIIAVVNDEPGNGQFVAFIEMLEHDAETRGHQFTVTEFFNDRLRDWFVRRGYEYMPEIDTVRHTPPVDGKKYEITLKNGRTFNRCFYNAAKNHFERGGGVQSIITKNDVACYKIDTDPFDT